MLEFLCSKFSKQGYSNKIFKKITKISLGFLLDYFITSKKEWILLVLIVWP